MKEDTLYKIARSALVVAIVIFTLCMVALLIPANSTSLADTGTPPLQYSRLSGTDMARYVDLEYGYVCYANAKSSPMCFRFSR